MNHVPRCFQSAQKNTTTEAGLNQVTQAASKPSLYSRTNDAWIADLRGQNGCAAQQLAHHDLSAYLYVVILNYLRHKYAKSTTFTDIQDSELATFVGDYVQDFMVKMMRNDYALLDKYSAHGRFTSWAAQVAHNLVGGEMRKAYWRREFAMPHEDLHDMLSDEESSPEFLAMRSTVGETLEHCLHSLPDHYRTVIERCILHGEAAIDIAKEEKVSPNSIYIRLHRAKIRLRQIAISAGVEPNILGA